jgi:60 kDa SS-A/Ro ribonucleoprotein
MARYFQHFAGLFTRQRDQARADQAVNSAGGYAFTLGPFARLDRWLVLGAEGGTYYASERALTRENAQTVLECLAADGVRTVERIVEISTTGRAPKNAPAIFALAMAAADPDLATRKLALGAMPLVCRTGTDLFRFVADVGAFRRWGRALRSAVAAWYDDKAPDALAYQLLKYRSRDGWSHRDVLRLAHPTPKTAAHAALYRHATAGLAGLGADTAKGKAIAAEDLPIFVRAFEAAMASDDRAEVIALIREHRLTHELVRTELKNDAAVWAALLEDMPLGAMIRNLGKMTAVGLVVPGSEAARTVASRLVDGARLRKARVHPVSVLSALRVYEQGHGERAARRANALSWAPVRAVVDALDEAFHLAFENVPRTGKKHLLALDVSGSMTCGAIAGVPGLSPRVASAAMAMATARAEPHTSFVAFTSGAGGLRKLALSPDMRLDGVLRAVDGLPFGGTDCSLPMRWATEHRVPVDVFVVYTDNETWAGPVHPFQALREYRQRLGRDAKLAVVGMTATKFTIADPKDPGMLDVVGFDAAAPQVMADFARG